MNEYTLTISTVRDGPVGTLIGGDCYSVGYSAARRLLLRTCR